MMNSVIGVPELGELDKFIRNIINEMIGEPALSKDIFCTANKNGGFGLRLLAERWRWRGNGLANSVFGSGRV
jgi:hypothetical protein